MGEEEIRLFFHGLLAAAFPNLGLYYRPPGTIILPRPCIVYSPTQAEPAYANNTAYVTGTQFQVLVMSDLPGISGVRDIIFGIKGVTVVSNRTYVEQDVVHDAFTVSVHTI